MASGKGRKCPFMKIRNELFNDCFHRKKFISSRKIDQGLFVFRLKMNNGRVWNAGPWNSVRWTVPAVSWCRSNLRLRFHIPSPSHCRSRLCLRFPPPVVVHRHQDGSHVKHAPTGGMVVHHPPGVGATCSCDSTTRRWYQTSNRAGGLSRCSYRG